MTLAILRCRVAFLAALVALIPVPARAGDPQHAKEMFQQGSVYFDLGEFDKAIDIWQRGYEEKQDPGFLYNIAQSYRLSHRPRKAVFFYKSFLRNSPDAPNRREIEQKIAAQEKLISTEERGKPDAPEPATAHDAKASSPAPLTPPPADAATAIAPSPLPIAPSPSVTPPLVSSSSSTPAPPIDAPREGPVAVAVAIPDAATRGVPDRRFDIGAALGANAWMSGVRSTASPSLSLAATFGYTFGGPDAGRTTFRLGGRLGYTFLSDAGSRITFFSALIDPGLRIRVSSERLYLTADLGIGVLAVAGLGGTSALFALGTPVTVNGTQSMLEVRPGIGIEYRLRPSLALVGETAVAYSPKRTYFYAPIARLDLLFGLLLRL